MLNFFFSSETWWFGVPAALGTLVFALRVAMLVIGLGAEHVGADLGEFSHSDPGQAFEILSIQSLAAFAMGFGWCGLAASFSMNWPMLIDFPVAIAGGAAMVWLLATLLRLMVRMESSGNVTLASMVGAEGEVYVNIPPRGAGQGQVRVICNQRQRIVNAVADPRAAEGIPSRCRVRVVGSNEDNTVTVAPVA